METYKEKLIRFLLTISLGKYSPKLYHRGQAYASTWLSGILTVVLLTLVSIGSLSVLSQTLSRGLLADGDNAGHGASPIGQ